MEMRDTIKLSYERACKEVYGEKVSEDGKGSPIMVEYYKGEVKVGVWDDINKEDPKIISMEKARETNREPEGTSQ